MLPIEQSVQGKHPVAFESRKLNDSEQRYSTHEKEATALVHCLRTRRHYSLGSKFIVRTDNSELVSFLHRKKLTLKQAHW